MKKMILHIILVLGLFISLASCERRPLLEGSGKAKVRVVLKVKAVANVTTGFYNEHIPVPKISPEIIRVMFYDSDTKKVVSQGFISNKGVDDEGYEYLEGDIIVKPGQYDMVCYNFDTSTTLVKDEVDINTIEAYTSEISEYYYSRFSARSENLLPSIYYEPDHLVVAKEEGIIVHAKDELVLIHADAYTVVDTYYIQVRLVNGEYASDAVAVLTDLVPSNKFGLEERKNNEYSGTFFEMHRSTDPRIRANNQEVLCAVFNTFGKRPDEIEPSVESQLYVTFNVITVDGRKVEMTVDMDEVFRTREAIENHWLLIDKEFVIPKPDNPSPPPGGQNMFNPEMEEWEQENGYIEL